MDAFLLLFLLNCVAFGLYLVWPAIRSFSLGRLIRRHQRPAWHHGGGYPMTSEGEPGDVYIQDENGAIFRKVANGTWIRIQ